MRPNELWQLFVVGLIPSNLRKTVGVGSILIVAIAAAVFWRRLSDPIVGVQLDSHRRVVPRVADFRYAPYRGGGGVKPSAGVLLAAGRIAKEFATVRNAETYHRLGVAQLALGDVDRATDLMASASQAEPGNARILSDLSAAEIAAGKIADGAEHAALAIQRDSSLASAHFNWSLALEGIGNRAEAIKAWRRYVTIDPASEWAEEARSHLDVLTKPRPVWETDRRILVPGAPRQAIDLVVARYPQRSRYWLQAELLPHFAESHSPADLELAQRIASARGANGDPFLQDVVAHAASHPESVAPGFRTFADARRIGGERHMDAAAVLYDQAIANLKEAGSPLLLAALVFSASNDFYRNDYTHALSRLDEVDRALKSSGNRYGAIAAEADWVRSLILARSGDGHEVEILERARAAAVRANESETVLALDTLLVSANDRAGRTQDAEQYRIQVLRRMADSDPSPEREATFFARCALSSLELHRPHVALAFCDAALDLPIVSREALFRADLQATRALALHASGAVAESTKALDLARHAAALVETSALQDRAASEVDFIDGIFEKDTDPHRAVSLFSSVLQTWQRRGWHLRTARAFLARGNALRALGDHKDAERDYEAGIEEMETKRKTFAEPELRVAFFEESGDLFEQLIGLLVQQGRHDEALAVAERKRARWLLDHRFADTTPEPLRPREIRKALPPGTVVLQYALLPEAVSIWLILPSRVVYGHSSASRRQIAADIEQYDAAIQSLDTKAVEAEGKWLYEQLIGPVQEWLPLEALIVIVPDGELGALPFAALRNGSGKYLVDLHALLYAPSATMFVQSHASKRSESILAVALPGEGTLPRLDAVEEEVATIASFYRRRTVLTGVDATQERFLSGLQVADIAHFAGHAQGDALLFGAGDDAHSLRAKTIASATFPSGPLVVLAACSTAKGRPYRTEGVASLAVAFLHGGARGVVATLWDVEDRSMSHFVRLLHVQLRDGVGAAEAVRRVQRSMIASSSPADRSPVSWAGMILVGRG